MSKPLIPITTFLALKDELEAAMGTEFEVLVAVVSAKGGAPALLATLDPAELNNFLVFLLVENSNADISKHVVDSNPQPKKDN